VAAAEHALRKVEADGGGNPRALFAKIAGSEASSGMWMFITQGDEERARLRLGDHLHGAPQLACAARPRAKSAPILSEDARLVAAARDAETGLRGESLMRQFLRAYPDWTVDRWRRATAEIEADRLRRISANA